MVGDEISVLGKADKADIRTDPFPHIVVRDALPQDVFDELIGSFPNTEETAGPRPLGSNELALLGARQVAEYILISDAWKFFFEYHTSQAFFLDMIELWQEYIFEAYPDFEDFLGKSIGDLTTGIRHSGRANNPANLAQDFQLDCQFGVNSPVVGPSSVRGPHVDSPNKLFAGLLYFRDPDDDSVGGELEQYRYTDPRLHYRPGRAVDCKSFVGMSAQDLSSVPEGDVEKVSSVPYGANVLVMWLNTPYALHGVSPRHPTAWTRKYVNFIGESFAGDGAGFFKMTCQPSR